MRGLGLRPMARAAAMLSSPILVAGPLSATTQSTDLPARVTRALQPRTTKAVPARKEFIKNSAKLFQRDAALVRKQHCLSPSFAANKKKQLEQNYNLLLQQTSH